MGGISPGASNRAGTAATASSLAGRYIFSWKGKVMGELIDKAKGVANETIGKIKRESDDPETRAEGDAQEAKGDFQKAKGEVKGALGDKI